MNSLQFVVIIDDPSHTWPLLQDLTLFHIVYKNSVVTSLLHKKKSHEYTARAEWKFCIILKQVVHVEPLGSEGLILYGP
jgi:hypothetical protein